MAGMLAPRTLGEALRLLMFRGGLTAERLAEAASVSRTALSAYLADEREPNASKLYRVVDALARACSYDTPDLLMEVNTLVASKSGNVPEDAPAPWVTFQVWDELADLGQEVSWAPCGDCGAHCLVRVPVYLLKNEPEVLVNLQRLCHTHRLDASVRVEGDDLVREVWPEGNHKAPVSFEVAEVRTIVPPQTSSAS